MKLPFERAALTLERPQGLRLGCEVLIQLAHLLALGLELLPGRFLDFGASGQLELHLLEVAFRIGALAAGRFLLQPGLL